MGAVCVQVSGAVLEAKRHHQHDKAKLQEAAVMAMQVQLGPFLRLCPVRLLFSVSVPVSKAADQNYLASRANTNARATWARPSLQLAWAGQMASEPAIHPKHAQSLPLSRCALPHSLLCLCVCLGPPTPPAMSPGHAAIMQSAHLSVSLPVSAFR